MKPRRSLRWTFLILAGLIVLLAAAPGFSQSCALCYTHAASSGSKMIAALKSGILILVVPPTIMSVALIFIVHRKTHEVRRTDNSDESSRDW